VILSKFWFRSDLQNFRKRKFLVDDQGELGEGTVLNLVDLRVLLAAPDRGLHSGPF
jgi:hypothetical protein